MRLLCNTDRKAEETDVPGRRHSSREIAGKLEQVDALIGEGKTLSEATKAVGVSRQTLYRWRGDKRPEAANPPRQLRDLEDENNLLRRLLVDLLLQKLAIEDALKERD